MSEFKFSCPECGQHLQGDDGYVGNEITCPRCKHEFTVPNPKVTTSLRIEHERWVPPPTHAHAAPATIILPSRAPAPAPSKPKGILLSKTSGLAIAALVLSLIEPIGCVPAIICGHIAKARIAKDPQLKGNGFALAGLIIGYVCLMLNLIVLTGFLVHGVHWINSGRQ